jgi:hypothetical protein
MHDAANALRDIRTDMRKWRESVHGSLSVFVRNGDVKDKRMQGKRDAFIAERDEAHHQVSETEIGPDGGTKKSGDESALP